MMFTRFARIAFFAAMVVAYVHAMPSVGEAFSLLHPFTADEPAPRPTVSRVAAKQPSTWDKVTSGTKNFFNKTGETLGLKKPEKKPKPKFAYAKPQTVQRQKPESKSWFGSMFGPKEPRKPRDVGEWMDSTKRMDP